MFVIYCNINFFSGVKIFVDKIVKNNYIALNFELHCLLYEQNISFINVSAFIDDVANE